MNEKVSLMDREIPFQHLEKIWEARGLNNKAAQPVYLPLEWKSGYGLPIAVACRELTFSSEQSSTAKRVAIALFEDRSFKPSEDRLVPIGYIIGKTLTQEDGKPQLICYDNEGLSLMQGGKSYPGIKHDPLFDRLSQWHSDTSEFRKIYLSALRVGWDQTYGEARKRKIQAIINDRSKDAEDLTDLNDSHRLEKLSVYQHTNLELGKLLIHLMLFAGKKIGSSNIYLVGPHKNVRRMINKSGFSTEITDTSVLPSFANGNVSSEVIVVFGNNN